MKNKTATFLAALIVAAASLQAHADLIGYNYDWSAGGSVITLNAANSPPGGGSYSDIISADILGNWIYGSELSASVNPGFTWNSTEITGIDLSFTDGTELDGGVSYPVLGYAETDSLSTIHPEGEYEYYSTGSWLAGDPEIVPDAIPTGLLFAIGLAGIAVVLKRRRATQPLCG